MTSSLSEFHKSIESLITDITTIHEKLESKSDILVDSLKAEISTIREQVDKVLCFAETYLLKSDTISTKKKSLKRTKKTAGANEDADIKKIIDDINNKKGCGKKIIEVFHEKFPDKQIYAARARQGSSRGTHYDFEIQIDNEQWVRVEHKGSQKCEPIRKNERPWDAGVQFHNGGCEKYKLAMKYAKIWFNRYIMSNKLKEEFDIKAQVPKFEDWYVLDCKAQGTPKTEFGRELKVKVQEKNGPNTSLRDLRAPVLAELEITEDDKENLSKEVLDIANEALDQKDYWLTIHGNLEGDFYCAWYSKFKISGIKDIIVKKNKDLEFEFLCEDDFRFNGILRWGYGAGFSNLRLDLR